jgi:hypothetical protein
VEEGLVGKDEEDIQEWIDIGDLIKRKRLGGEVAQW